MIVNTLDNMINVYDMHEILSKPPVRYFGHRSSKEFYIRASLGLDDNLILSGSEDGFVYLWDLRNHQHN